MSWKWLGFIEPGRWINELKFSAIQSLRMGVLYGTSPQLKLFALNASTGTVIWEFDPKAFLASEDIEFGLNQNRGVVLWENDDDNRVFVTLSHWLICINSKTGEAVSSFGDSGRASLKEGLGERSKNLHINSTTPGVLFEDLLIVCTRVSENAGAAPGHIRAFNVRTGEMAWTFYTIPQPGEFGADTWPEGSHEEAGGANSWSGMSIDRERGMVFVPTGSASFDFHGGNRHGENLFANCILALVARSDLVGEEAWPTQPIPVRPEPFARQRFDKEDATNISEVANKYVRGILENLRSDGQFIPPSLEGTVIFSGFDGGGEWGGASIDPSTGIMYVNGNEMAWVMTIVESRGGLDVVAGEANRLADYGESLYMGRCAFCHGPDLQGDPTGTFPNIQAVGERLQREAIGEAGNRMNVVLCEQLPN